MHILKKYSTLQQGTHKIGFECYSEVSLYFRITLWTLNFKFIIKNTNIFALNMFGLKCCFRPYIPKLSKTTSSQKLFDYDCVTLCPIVIIYVPGKLVSVSRKGYGLERSAKNHPVIIISYFFYINYWVSIIENIAWLGLHRANWIIPFMK